MAKMDALNRLQVGTATELDALLPAILDKSERGRKGVGSEWPLDRACPLITVVRSFHMITAG
jgi:hypothetical protein